MSITAPPRALHWEILGSVDYERALGLQEGLREARIEGRIPDALLLLEHPPVLTVGRGGDAKNILASQAVLEANGIRIHQIGRGGDVTYHGPGQLVGYPIVDLRRRGRDVHRYLRDLEEVFLRLLTRRGLPAERVPGATGVWVEGRKILSIGVGVRKWVTLHGVAFNVCPDLSHFGLIRPCGFEPDRVTSLKELLPETFAERDPAAVLGEVARETVGWFAEVFGVETRRLKGRVPEAEALIRTWLGTASAPAA